MPHFRYDDWCNLVTELKSKKRLVTKRNKLLRECREIIYALIDDEPCDYDHHGYCQTHGWMSTDLCPNERGKRLLTKIDNAIGEK